MVSSTLLLLLLLPRLSLLATTGGLAVAPPAGGGTWQTLPLLRGGGHGGPLHEGSTVTEGASWRDERLGARGIQRQAGFLHHTLVNVSGGVYRVEGEHNQGDDAGGRTFFTTSWSSNINPNITNKNTISDCSGKKLQLCGQNFVAGVAADDDDDEDLLAPVTTTTVGDGIPYPPLKRFLWWWLRHGAAGPEGTAATPAAAPVASSPLSVDGLAGTVCGVSGRIVGGVESAAGAWPWAVLVSDKRGEPFCGGTLISLRHVLTAAHCTTGKAIERMYPISVTVGEHDLLDPSESPSQTLGVAYALFHADFGKEAQFDNDVAVLVLAAALDPRLNLMPACLPSPDYNVSGSVVTVVGWGATHEGGSSSNVLREAHIPVLQDSTCQTSYPGSFLPEKMICAGYLVGRTDTCQGDSGGPVTHQEGPTEPWTVVGVVSFGRGCARPGYPGVYTRITTFLPWLTKVMHLYP